VGGGGGEGELTRIGWLAVPLARLLELEGPAEARFFVALVEALNSIIATVILQK
jgi:hypothetical protein